MFQQYFTFSWCIRTAVKDLSLSTFLEQFDAQSEYGTNFVPVILFGKSILYYVIHLWHVQASQKSKEKWQLQLLLTYLQNGISKPWQRIPSIIAIFAAEASLTLLDSSHTQFNTISKFLMNSASVDMQVGRLFLLTHVNYPELWISFCVYLYHFFFAEHSIISNIIEE